MGTAVGDEIVAWAFAATSWPIKLKQQLLDSIWAYVKALLSAKALFWMQLLSVAEDVFSPALIAQRAPGIELSTDRLQ